MSSSLPGVKSCTTCPSFLKPQNAASARMSTGGAMCARFGTVLSRPGAEEDAVEKTCMAIAANCSDHGKPGALGIQPGREKSEVFLPSPKVFSNPPSAGDPMHNAVSNCQMCTNYVDADVVQSETGWTTGLCKAKGKLIFPNALKQNAKGCEYRYAGPRARDISEMTMLPEYVDAFELATDPIKAYFQKQRDGLVDPQEYPTDRPVTPDEAKVGVRAFRKIYNPDDAKQFVFLPIFDRESIPVQDQPKIPMINDDEHPELYIDHGGLVYRIAVLWTELDETPAAWGEPGVGKTELYRHMAWLMALPFIRISITGSSELDDLAGKANYTPEKGTFFKPGRVVTGWSSKCVLCIDEPNTGPPDVWQFLRPLTDNSKQLVLDMSQGEIIPRNDDCYLGLAMNPDWDPRNRGAEPLADADGSRLMHVWVPTPPPELEKEIIRSRVRLDGWEIDDKRLNTLMKIAGELRRLSEQGDLNVSWGIRPQIKVARAWRFFGLLDAFRLGSADYLEPAQQATMLDIVRAHSS